MFTLFRKRRWLLAVCGLLAAGLCASGIVAYWKRDDLYWSMARRPTSEELVNLLGGSQVASILHEPERVEAARIAPPTFERSWEPIEYEELEIREKVPASVAADISHVLLTPEENREMLRKSCVPLYGIRLSYFRESDQVDIYFCFECAILAVYLNGKPVGGNSFDYSYQRLIADAQQVFPYDRNLSKMASQRRR